VLKICVKVSSHIFRRQQKGGVVRRGHFQSGFNLVELMVAIGIISILVMHGISTYEKTAKTAAAYAQIKSLAKQLAAAREALGNGDMTILEIITQHGPSAHSFYSSCNVPEPLRNPGSATMTFSATCREDANLFWKALGWPKAPLSPWGDPIMMDVNDEEPEWIMMTSNENMPDWLLVWIPHLKRYAVADVPVLRRPTTWSFKRVTGYE
jgi:prepilin-type N-terminal cleavage/methylation domain-containing protein